MIPQIFLIKLILATFLSLHASSQTVSEIKQPLGCVYVKTENRSIALKRAGQTEWQDFDKLAYIFAGDTLKIPANVTVLWSNTRASWQEITGPKAFVAKKKVEQENRFLQLINRLYITFFIETERHRRSTEGVRAGDRLLLLMPDTVYAFALPKQIKWSKSAPWWTKYQLTVSHAQKTLLDTTIQCNTLSLEQYAEKRQTPGDYQVKIVLRQSPLPDESDICIIRLLPPDDSRQKQLAGLKKQFEEKGALQDHMALLNFYLEEKFYLDFETALIRSIKKFPETIELRAMLHAYYLTFMPDNRAARLVKEQIL